MPDIAFIALTVAVAVAYALYRYYPRATERWFRRIATARRLIWTVLLLAFATTLLMSGSPFLVLVAAAILGYAVLYVLFEEPFGPVREYLGI